MIHESQIQKPIYSFVLKPMANAALLLAGAQKQKAPHKGSFFTIHSAISLSRSPEFDVRAQRRSPCNTFNFLMGLYCSAPDSRPAINQSAIRNQYQQSNSRATAFPSQPRWLVATALRRFGSSHQELPGPVSFQTPAEYPYL